MNIYVCLKQVPDTEANLTIRGGIHINEDGIKWIMNPYDEYAIEEALKLKESVSGSSVTVVTAGPARVESTLRSGLAMGADHAVHIELDDSLITPKSRAGLLANLIKEDVDFGLIFMGKQAIDTDDYQTHLYLAEYLGVPVATNVITFSLDGDKVMVEREIDEGSRERIEMEPRAIIAATKGLNEPRYASLMGIMKAKKIPIKKVSPADLGLTETDTGIKRLGLRSPAEKPPGRVLEGETADTVKELVRLLKEEAKVL